VLREFSMIKRIGDKYVVVSETTGRRFGTYHTRAEAERRLRQIEFFKHLSQRSRLRGGRGLGDDRAVG
jgi:hypothetical protein